MRSFKLVPLLAATAALLAVVPSGAAARRAHSVRPHASRPCRIHIETPKAPIAGGEPVTVTGTLSCPKAEEASGRQITLLEQSAPKPGFTSVGSATTEKGGAFQVPLAALTTNSTFYAIAEGAQSAHRTIRVSAPITVGPPTPAEGTQLYTAGGVKLRRHNRITFAGEVNALNAGAVVVLQREDAAASENWHAIARSTVDAQGKFAIVHSFLVPGAANIRVVVRPLKVNGVSVNAPAASSPMSYEISQAQNPALKIEGTPDPLLYGQSVKITGVVAGAGANTPLTLLAGGKGGGFQPVATGHTGAGGVYEFTQTPLTNTLYRVTAAKASSAVVFEGVKYALNVATAPSSVAAGQPATFSGSMLPALTGHVVYLERQSPSKLGWHVMDIGTVGAAQKPGEAAPFTILHTFRTPGAYHLRIKIPGDPGNQGTAGAPFELQVTPAPASTLRPEAPGESRRPSEGQL